MRQHHATFANFICRFGDKKVLLDYAEQIVLPAFTDDTLIRTFGDKSEYHFFDVKVERLEEGALPTLAVTGRFIKNTQLTRQQYLHGKELVQDPKSLPSAPSSYFILILNNHRLIYFPETAHAPDLKAFKATVQRFLDKKYKQFIKDKYEIGNGEVTKRDLYEQNPSPKLEIVPLVNEEGISKFITRFEVLKKIEIRLITPNDEFHAGDTLNQMRDLFLDMGSQNTKVISTNKDGLNIPKTISAVNEIAASGNQDVQLSGIDKNGNALSGDNDEFKINSPIEEVPASRKTLNKTLLNKFNELVSSGAIKVPPQSHETKSKIKELVETT